MRGQPRLLLRRVDDLLARPLAKGPLSHQPVHLANRDGVEHRAQGLLIERRVPHAHVVQVTVERVLARQAAQMHLSLGVTLALVALSDHLEMVTQRAVEVQPELVPVIHTGNVGPPTCGKVEGGGLHFTCTSGGKRGGEEGVFE
eukprot:scaffold5004_cov110-Isochrysis_galbana.AAC.1